MLPFFSVNLLFALEILIFSQLHSIVFNIYISVFFVTFLAITKIKQTKSYVIVDFPNFTNIAPLLCSHSGWLHLNCSSIGTGFKGAETNCRTAYNLGILLMNSNRFAIFFSSILVMSVQISILFLKLVLAN
mgnify:FL=1